MAKKKQQPSSAPERRTLEQSVALALKNESARRSVGVKLTIRGGVEAQAYEFDFSATGSGASSCSLDCRSSGRRARKQTAKLEPKDFVRLLQKVDQALKLPQETPSFLPDTLIGILEISDGTNMRRFYFAADPEQAKTQGKLPAPALRGAVEAIYSFGARMTGSRSVKP